MIEPIWKFILIAALGYLLGNFQTGVLVARLKGTDIRKEGSQSAGTTNVLRTLGWLPSVLTMAGDIVKALIAALIGLWMGGEWGARIGGICAVIGHIWPALFGFKGGKGIASSFGMILVTDPLIALCLLICQAVVLVLTHTMSLASIVSAGLYALLMVIFYWGQWSQVVCGLILAAMVVWSHRGNIARLANRKENKLDFEEINRISREKK